MSSAPTPAATPAQRVFVGMPVYNGAQTVEATLRNLLEQTYKDFQILVYDDGSTDKTADIVTRLAEKDSRVVLHRGDGNRGRGFARNKLVELASGGILAWQDADDSWHPEKLEQQLGVLQPLLAQGTRAIVLSTYEIVTLGETERQIKHPPGIMDAAHVFTQQYRSYHFQLQAVIGEADLFSGAGGFDDEMNWSEDIDLALKLIKAGVLLVGHDSPEPMATYNHSLRQARVSLIEESQGTLVERFGEYAASLGYDFEKTLALRNVGYLSRVYLQSDRPQKALEVTLRALVSIDPNAPDDVARLEVISKTLLAILKGNESRAPERKGAATGNQGSAPQGGRGGQVTRGQQGGNWQGGGQGGGGRQGGGWQGGGQGGGGQGGGGQGGGWQGGGPGGGNRRPGGKGPGGPGPGRGRG